MTAVRRDLDLPVESEMLDDPPGEVAGIGWAEEVGLVTAGTFVLKRSAA
jgi:hypothetical protein